MTPKKLRAYQTAAVEATRSQLQQYDSTVVVLPTGTGKTVYAARLISEWGDGNCLFLAHTRELVEQSADKLAAELGFKPHIEMADRGADPDTLWAGDMVVVGSVQSMISDRRLEKFRNYPFSLIVADECFPAGTLVDGRPIELIRVGDQVTAFDERTNRLVRRPVTRLFRKPAPDALVTVHAGGRSVTATRNHPFHTLRGWVNAGDLQLGDGLYGMFQDVRRPARPAADETPTWGHATVLQSPMLYSLAAPDPGTVVRAVPDIVHGSQANGPTAALRRQAGLLFSGLRAGGSRGGVGRHDGCDQSQVRIREDGRPEPDATRGCPAQSLPDHEGAGLLPDGAGWERTRHDRTGTETVGRHGPVPARHRGWSDRWLPVQLQIGPGQPADSVGGRDRWRQSRHAEGAGRGREEDGLLGIARVDRVEVHQRGSVGRHRSVCPDGRVYNIEVEGEHTYLANRFAVHNCHHSTSASWRRVFDFFRSINPSLKLVGITATPNRADGTALGLVFQSVAYQMSITDAIDQGWLVPFRPLGVTVDGLDLSDIKVRKGEGGEADFNQEELEAILTEERTLHEMATPILEQTGDRPTLVFTAGVKHAHLMADVLNRHKSGTARAVDGTTDKQQRADIIRDFTAGRIQYLANCQVLTEGFDAPACACVVMGRPTKSLSLYQQMLGRGLRPLPGIVDGVESDFDRRMAILTSEKSDCLVLDFVGAGAKGVVDAYDVLGGHFDVETRELARKERSALPEDAKKQLELARLILQLGREWSARKGIKGRADYSVHEGGGGAMTADTSEVRGGATDGQIAFLVKLGVRRETAMGYTKGRAGAIIDKLRATTCTSGQAAALQRAGIDPTGIGIDKASKMIDAIKSNGGKLPEGWTPS